MIVSAASNAASALDPTAQVLLTVFGAAIVTALAGFAGAALQGRREHKRWVRQERLAAYLDFLRFAHGLWDLIDDRERIRAALDEIRPAVLALREEQQQTPPGADRDALVEKMKTHNAKLDQLQQSLSSMADKETVGRASLIESSVACFLLGPGRVADAAARVAEATTESASAVMARIEEMETEMRRALQVS